MSFSLRRSIAACWAVAAALSVVPAEAQKAFPYEAELRLDADPMPGTERLPWLQFSEGGTVAFDLWCATGSGTAVIVERTLTIVPTALRDHQCSPEQLDADKAFLSSLMQVTAWRWEGPLLVLAGPVTLRWRPASN